MTDLSRAYVAALCKQCGQVTVRVSGDVSLCLDCSGETFPPASTVVRSCARCTRRAAVLADAPLPRRALLDALLEAGWTPDNMCPDCSGLAPVGEYKAPCGRPVPGLPGTDARRRHLSFCRACMLLGEAAADPGDIAGLDVLPPEEFAAAIEQAKFAQADRNLAVLDAVLEFDAAVLEQPGG